MNVLELRERLVQDYADYTRSFVVIRDERIRELVDRELEPEDEKTLTEWMIECLVVKVVTDLAAPLGELERQVGGVLRSPLDQERAPLWSPNPWRRQVAEARKRFPDRAREQAGRR